MCNIFRSLILADIKVIFYNSKLLISCMILLSVIILLTLFYPEISDYIFSNYGILTDNYYPLTALTLIALIPMLFGILYGFILLNEIKESISAGSKIAHATRRNYMHIRIIFVAALSFILVITAIFFTNPVPDQGWLRTLFAALLFSVQSVFCLLFIGSLGKTKIFGLALSRVYWIFLIVLPLGLLLHHPWNYLAFFSPLYWVTWAWIVQSPVESLIYGSIAVIMTVSVAIMLYSRYINKQTT